jgi:hypothetical protein
MVRGLLQFLRLADIFSLGGAPAATLAVDSGGLNKFYIGLGIVYMEIFPHMGT